MTDPTRTFDEYTQRPGVFEDAPHRHTVYVPASIGGPIALFDAFDLGLEVDE